MVPAVTQRGGRTGHSRGCSVPQGKARTRWFVVDSMPMVRCQDGDDEPRHARSFDRRREGRLAHPSSRPSISSDNSSPISSTAPYSDLASGPWRLPPLSRARDRTSISWRMSNGSFSAAQIKFGDLGCPGPDPGIISISRFIPAINSNTQYALLGLNAASEAGLTIRPEVWVAPRTYSRVSQNRDGGWGLCSTRRGTGNRPRV